MLKGYEKLTEELRDDEISKIDSIIKGIAARTGKENAVSSKVICKSMNLDPVRLRKIIHHIRLKGLLFGLCSSSKGYYTARPLDELEECIISLKQRIRSQVDVLNALEGQTLMFGGNGQLTLFE